MIYIPGLIDISYLEFFMQDLTIPLFIRLMQIQSCLFYSFICTHFCMCAIVALASTILYAFYMPLLTGGRLNIWFGLVSEHFPAFWTYKISQRKLAYFLPRP